MKKGTVANGKRKIERKENKIKRQTSPLEYEINLKQEDLNADSEE